MVGLDNLPPKCPVAFLEFPVFHPGDKPLREPYEWRYLSNRKNKSELMVVNIYPTKYGRPTIQDLDLIMFYTSQLVARLDRGIVLSNPIRFHANKFFEYSKSGSGGRDYDRLFASLRRLSGTLISTNVFGEGYETIQDIHLIDSWAAKRINGRLLEIEVSLSPYLYDAILVRDILTLSPEYFCLRSKFDRRLYLICHKHLGDKEKWNINLEKLFVKHGAGGSLKAFKHKLSRRKALTKFFSIKVMKGNLVQVRKAVLITC
jgi:plasmid replication initiation protein